MHVLDFCSQQFIYFPINGICFVARRKDKLADYRMKDKKAGKRRC